MFRRRRRSTVRAAVPAAGTAVALWWAWSQPWGRFAFAAATALAVLAVLGRAMMAARRRRRHRRALATLGGLLALSPAEFEVEVAYLLTELGFTGVHLTAGAGDLQADIVAADPDGHATIVQCKRYAPERTIGSPIIQSFIGMARIHHECERALFVTTASFTAPAHRLADEHDIELIDGADLVDLFTRHAGLVPAR
jgi:restriction system protein